MGQESEKGTWDYFEQTSYNEMRNMGSSRTMRKWVVNQLNGAEAEPISPRKFGRNAKEIINNGGKKFSGLLASVIDYYEAKGIEEFEHDTDQYIGFLLNALAFDTQIVTDCQAANYKGIAVAHTAEHAADTAIIIAKHRVCNAPEEADAAYTQSLKMRAIAEDFYVSEGDFARQNQLKLNKVVRTIDVVDSIMSGITSLPELERYSRTFSDFEMRFIMDMAFWCLDSYSFRKRNEQQIAASLQSQKPDIDVAASMIRTSKFFDQGVLFRSLTSLNKHYLIHTAYFTSKSLRLIHGQITHFATSNDQKVYIDTILSLMQVSGVLGSLGLLLSTQEPEFYPKEKSDEYYLISKTATVSISEFNKSLPIIDKMGWRLMRIKFAERAAAKFVMMPRYKTLRTLLSDALLWTSQNPRAWDRATTLSMFEPLNLRIK